MLSRNRIVTIGLALALVASPVALTACGGSSSSDSESTATEATTDNTASSESTATDSSSSTQSYSISTSEITEAYMGASEAGETIYYVGNSDGSKTGIFFLDADNMANVSFMGPATVTQQNGENLITITDELSGNTLTFGVTNNDDGTITIDMGNELGKAILAQADVAETVNAIKTIQTNTTSVQ
ncbi:hypothetical protein SAMN05216348_102196 [Olsenella sp. KH3B4]|uniref:hypothetical protein n=1 Tax=Olsenella sp. KH3B4 TaxID=1855394 RepID=UPI0008CC418D|nr:hypothetical protein [Olsenella sp. KH3B4]SES75140.1 hypothetical protein SAMN05216348_102196 [Olsenella sp. KH3B4]